MRRGVTSAAAIAVLGVALLGAGRAKHVDVRAEYDPAATPGGEGAILAWFEPRAAAYVVNEKPAPRLALDPEQTILEDRQPPPPDKLEPFDPETAVYLDPADPVRFPVAIAPGAPSGMHVISGKVTFFYCSKTAGWCRRGSQKLDLAIRVP